MYRKVPLFAQIGLYERDKLMIQNQLIFIHSFEISLN